MEGAGPLPLGAQPSTARETQGASQIRLVGALRTRLARFETVAGEGSGWTLTWIWFKENRFALVKYRTLTGSEIQYTYKHCLYLRRRRCFAHRPPRDRHCRGRGRRPAARTSPGKYQVDTGHSAPAHRGSRTPAHIWLREDPQQRLQSEVTHMVEIHGLKKSMQILMLILNLNVLQHPVALTG